MYFDCVVLSGANEAPANTALRAFHALKATCGGPPQGRNMLPVFETLAMLRVFEPKTMLWMFERKTIQNCIYIYIYIREKETESE